MAAVDGFRILFALIAVLGMIGGIAFIAQRSGIAKTMAVGVNRRRLSLLEVLPIDQKRKAAILKCDGREHLIVLNANSVTVIERAIHDPKPSASEKGAFGEPVAEAAASFSFASSAAAQPPESNLLALPEPVEAETRTLNSTNAPVEIADIEGTQSLQNQVRGFWSKLAKVAPGIRDKLVQTQRDKDKAA